MIFFYSNTNKKYMIRKKNKKLIEYINVIKFKNSLINWNWIIIYFKILLEELLMVWYIFFYKEF